jgi:threonine dehydrogenase-like Zn-dependent dehydrogenase
MVLVIDKRISEATRTPSVNNSYFFTSNCNMIFLFIVGAGVGRLFEATGAPSVVNSCFSLLRKGAKMVLVGKYINTVHCKKMLPISLPQQGVTCRLGTGKPVNFFYSVVYLTKYSLFLFNPVLAF